MSVITKKTAILILLCCIRQTEAEIETNHDYVSKIYRFMLPVGVILEPTAFKTDSKKDFWGGIKGGLEFSRTDMYPYSHVGFSHKHKLFFNKIISNSFYKNKKGDFYNIILGYQFNCGPCIILNKSLNDCYFNSRNVLSNNIHSLNILLGFKIEIGEIKLRYDMNDKFPTKILSEILYSIDFNNCFSLYVSITVNRCFSPVYLLSFNTNDIKNVFNNNGYAWNIEINITLVGCNITI